MNQNYIKDIPKFSEKIALHNQKQAEETAEFEKIMKEVSAATSKSVINNSDVIKTNPGSNCRERAKSTVGPMRSRPGIEKRTDTSPYSSSYLSPPPDTNWRRTHSDSSLHTSSQEQIVQRRGTVDIDSHYSSDPFKRNISSSPVHHDGKSNSDLSRNPCISILTSSQPETISINTGSLPDLTSIHFPSPLDTPIDQDDCRSSYASNAHGNPVFSSSFMGQPRTSLVGTPPQEAPGPPRTPPQFVNQGVAQSCQAQYMYQHPISPLQSHSPQAVPSQQSNTLNSYRTPVSRPSPQASPSLSIRFTVGSPRSNSPQSPSSPGSVSSGMSPFPDQNNYLFSQTTALQHHFEQFNMVDDSCTQLTPDPGYFSTSPSHHVHYATGVGAPGVNTQTAPNTPSSIPDIVLTDFSNNDELTKELGVAMAASLESDLFSAEDDCLREGLDPIDLDGLQMLTDPDMITDPANEDHFRLDRL